MSGLLFAVFTYLSLSLSAITVFCVGLPPLLSPVECVYIAIIVVPSLSVSFIATPAN